MPSTSMRSVDGSIRRPRIATSPLTVTRPASIKASLARRDPKPARASTFCKRSFPLASSGVGCVLAGGFGALVGDFRCARVALDAQAALERLDDVGCGHEVG